MCKIFLFALSCGGYLDLGRDEFVGLIDKIRCFESGIEDEYISHQMNTLIKDLECKCRNQSDLILKKAIACKVENKLLEYVIHYMPHIPKFIQKEYDNNKTILKLVHFFQNTRNKPISKESAEMIARAFIQYAYSQTNIYYAIKINLANLELMCEEHCRKKYKIMITGQDIAQITKLILQTMFDEYIKQTVDQIYTDEVHICENCSDKDDINAHVPIHIAGVVEYFRNWMPVKIRDGKDYVIDNICMVCIIKINHNKSSLTLHAYGSLLDKYVEIRNLMAYRTSRRISHSVNEYIVRSEPA